MGPVKPIGVMMNIAQKPGMLPKIQPNDYK